MRPGRVAGAYQVADIVSKFIAVLLLPVYTRYIDPRATAWSSCWANGVILISILVRFGMIEAFLRYYFPDADQARRDALVRRAVAVPAGRDDDRRGGCSRPPPRRSRGYPRSPRPDDVLVAVLGLWSFTNLELA